MECPDCGEEVSLNRIETEDLSEAIEEAYGSLSSFVKKSDKKIAKEERPEQVTGVTEKIETPKGTMYVTVNSDQNGNPFEVFAQIGKAGGDDQAMTEAMARLVSACLRSGVDPEELIDQMEGIRGPEPAWDNGDKILSVPDGIATVMERHIGE